MVRPPVPRVHPSSRRPPGHLQFESMTQIKLITAFWYQNTGFGSGAYRPRAGRCSATWRVHAIARAGRVRRPLCRVQALTIRRDTRRDGEVLNEIMMTQD